MVRSLPVAVAALCLAACAAAQGNLFINPGFEQLDAKGQPEGWVPVEFGTGGKWAVGREGGRTGDGYVSLSATEEKNRSCWPVSYTHLRRRRC